MLKTNSIALGEHQPGDPDRARDRGRPDQLRLTRERASAVGEGPVEPHPGQQAAQQEDDVRLCADIARDDLREHEPVDARHDERFEHRPEVAEERRRVPHLEVAGRQQPQRSQVPPRRGPPARGRGQRSGGHRNNLAGKELDEQVGSLEVFGEVDLDRVQVGDVDRLEAQLVGRRSRARYRARSSPGRRPCRGGARGPPCRGSDTKLMPTASPRPPTTVFDSSSMKPSASTVYFTSSSLTLAVLTLTKLWSRATRSPARTSASGSKTTSPFIHSTPPSFDARSARRRLFEVLVWSYCSL